MDTFAAESDHTVLRLHCPHHPEVALVDFFLVPGQPPYIWWLMNHHELGDFGWEGRLWEGGNVPLELRPTNFTIQRVAGPNLVGRPGPWQNTWLAKQPADVVWDEHRGVGHRPRANLHYDPDTRTPHVRYEVRCLRRNCNYTATMTRPRLFDALQWLLDQRDTITKQIELLQLTGHGSTWTVTRPEELVAAPPNPPQFPQNTITYWPGHEPLVVNVEWDGLQRARSAHSE